ncbi:CdaR family transcriptional regulator [uncultured Agrococcus sp.]|uniref:PucR family transcriptional regulator n=1 Tax=uncultured Agrococcus sp. TaxID=382258 RepID=UPI0025D23C44|nr:helix-turn-helix domain-containing protein [uncultured Agrococcus sp.]
MSAELSTETLFAHSDNGGLAYVAGPVNREWEGSEIVDDIGGLENRTHSDALLILTSTLPATPWQQDALLRTVRDRGFAGIACQNARVADDGAKRLAERFRITVLETDDPFKLAKACWHLLEARDALTLHYIRKVAHAIEYPAAELNDLLAHFSANIGHSIALIDEGGPLLESRESLPADLHREIDFTKWLSTAASGRYTAVSVRVDSPARQGLRLIIYGVGIGDRQLHALGTVAEVMMPAVAARIMIDEHATVSDSAEASQLIRDFLEPRSRHDPHIERRMHQRGWGTAGAHVAFHVALREPAATYSVHRAIRRQLETSGLPAPRTSTHEQGVLGWLTFAEAPSPAALQSHLTTLRQAFFSVREHLDVAMGVGSLKFGAAGLVDSINEATGASRMATGLSKSGYLVQVERYGVEELLLTWTTSDAFLPAAETLLAPLNAESGALVETLAEYLDNGSIVQATSQAMGLHRNTVSMRIQRAQQLLGIDLSSSESRLALHLACRAVLGRR